jgi:hypothetical protein
VRPELSVVVPVLHETETLPALFGNLAGQEEIALEQIVRENARVKYLLDKPLSRKYLTLLPSLIWLAYFLLVMKFLSASIAFLSNSANLTPNPWGIFVWIRFTQATLA